MAAVAGILTTELIGAGGNWWVPDASAHVANGAPTARVFAEAALMAVAESFRLKAFEASGPGAKAFDPAGMNSEESRLKEIKNGRLAMVAFLGFTSQAAVRGLGPIACLKAHLADPGHVNIFTSSVGGEGACPRNGYRVPCACVDRRALPPQLAPPSSRSPSRRCFWLPRRR